METDQGKVLKHAVGSIDVKYIARKKPTKARSEFYNCKDFFFLILLALVDAEYRFLWVDVESSGSSSDVQICNCCKLKKDREWHLGASTTGPLVEGGPPLKYFLLGDDTFALKP